MLVQALFAARKSFAGRFFRMLSAQLLANLARERVVVPRFRVGKSIIITVLSALLLGLKLAIH